jgi:hypothetical protein
MSWVTDYLDHRPARLGVTENGQPLRTHNPIDERVWGSFRPRRSYNLVLRHNVSKFE